MYLFDIEMEADAAVDGLWHLDAPDLGLSFECRGSRREALAFAAREVEKEVQRLLLANKPISESEAVAGRHREGFVTLALSVDLPKDDLFSFEQTMAILDVSQPRVSHLVRDGKLVAIKQGRKSHITRTSLEAYLATPRTSGRPRTRTYGVERLTRTKPEPPSPRC